MIPIAAGRPCPLTPTIHRALGLSGTTARSRSGSVLTSVTAITATFPGPVFMITRLIGISPITAKNPTFTTTRNPSIITRSATKTRSSTKVSDWTAPRGGQAPKLPNYRFEPRNSLPTALFGRNASSTMVRPWPSYGRNFPASRTALGTPLLPRGAQRQRLEGAAILPAFRPLVATQELVAEADRASATPTCRDRRVLQPPRQPRQLLLPTAESARVPRLIPRIISQPSRRANGVT